MTTTSTKQYELLNDNIDIPILTKQLQDRKTAKMILSNGVRGVVISDPQTPVTGAALSVEAGSWMDGKYDGTAHFLEHMLFLGTKKYPNEYDYERYIYDSNGQLNGYTASDHSLYFFTSVTPAAFDGALDRFARFFYEPLFNESCVEREMNAVDEEYRKNIEQDGWRVLHVRKELADPSHPFAGFNTGNLETMKLIDQDTLKEWFRKNYSANQMHFALLGREPVEALAEKAAEAFSPIPNHNLPKLSTQGKQIFPKSLHGTLTWIEPIKNLKEMTLSWEIPYAFADQSTKPANLAAHILGYEGKNSLLSLLKKEELAEGLSAGKSHLGAENLMFEISVTLTEKGLANWRTVIQRIYEAISSLQSEQYPKHLFDEVNYMNKIGYQYQQRNTEIATQWAGMLRKEGIETFPKRSYFIERFDADAVHDLLKLLKPNTCIYTMIAQQAEFPLNKQEKWMGAKYAVKPLTTELSTWSASSPTPSIKYPPPNPYIPQNLQLSPTRTDAPELLLNTDCGKLYYFPDVEFQVPEASYMFNIKTPAIRPDDARSLVLAGLYVRFVHERLVELSYDAMAGGLRYDVHVAGDTGISLSIEGYSEKSHLLLQSLLTHLRSPKFTPTEFAIFKESLLRSYQNATKDSPIRQASDKLSEIIYEKYCSPSQLAAALELIQLADLEAFSQTLFERRFIEAFVGGNVSEADALRSLEVLQESIPGQPCSPSLVQKSGIITLPQQPTYHSFDVSVKGNAVIWALDCGPKTYENRTGQEIFSKLLKEPFYTELRTKQQTGYIVSSGRFEAGSGTKQLFLQSAIQSNAYPARDLLSRIELFNETFIRDSLTSTDITQRFDAVKQSLLARLHQPYDTLGSKLRFFNYVAFEEGADWEVIKKRREVLEGFGVGELRGWVGDKFEKGRRVGVLVRGGSEENWRGEWRERSLESIKGKL